MEAQGLLARARDEKDERQVRVTLTDTGGALRARAEGIHACIFEACGMELQELLRLRDGINALRDRLSATEPSLRPRQP